MAEVQNVQRLLRKMAAIPKAAQDEIKAAMAEQADEIVALMRRLAGDPKIVASIGWTWGNSAPKGAKALASVHTQAISDLAITIFAGSNDAFYTRWWEFGTAERHWKSGKSTGAMPRRPFFYVSWRASKKTARNKMRAALRKAVRQVAAQG